MLVLKNWYIEAAKSLVGYIIASFCFLVCGGLGIIMSVQVKLAKKVLSSAIRDLGTMRILQKATVLGLYVILTTQTFCF